MFKVHEAQVSDDTELHRQHLQNYKHGRHV